MNKNIPALKAFDEVLAGESKGRGRSQIHWKDQEGKDLAVPDTSNWRQKRSFRFILTRHVNQYPKQRYCEVRTIIQYTLRSNYTILGTAVKGMR